MAGPLGQRAASHVFTADGSWFDGSVQSSPAAGTVIADTGTLLAGNYLVAVHGASAADWAYDLQLRNAANTANVKVQRRRPLKGNEDFILPNKIVVAEGERLRVVTVGAGPSEVQVSIFTQAVE